MLEGPRTPRTSPATPLTRAHRSCCVRETAAVLETLAVFTDMRGAGVDGLSRCSHDPARTSESCGTLPVAAICCTEGLRTPSNALVPWRTTRSAYLFLIEKGPAVSGG